MGLDMYLTRHTYVKNWKGVPKAQQTKVKVTKGGKPLPGIDPDKVSYIIEEVGYWRKANAIHRWFVMNVQDGNDDCGEYYVSTEQLQELLDAVEKVLQASKLVEGTVNNGYTFGPNGEKIYHTESGLVIDNPNTAKNLLPTEEGFFFGSTDYDEYYVNDLKETQEILKDAIAVGGVYYYHSSW